MSHTQLLRELASIADPCGLFRTQPAFHTEIAEYLADVCDLGIDIKTVEFLGPYLMHTTRPHEGLPELC